MASLRRLTTSSSARIETLRGRPERRRQGSGTRRRGEESVVFYWKMFIFVSFWWSGSVTKMQQGFYCSHRIWKVFLRTWSLSGTILQEYSFKVDWKQKPTPTQQLFQLKGYELFGCSIRRKTVVWTTVARGKRMPSQTMALQVEIACAKQSELEAWSNEEYSQKLCCFCGSSVQAFETRRSRGYKYQCPQLHNDQNVFHLPSLDSKMANTD